MMKQFRPILWITSGLAIGATVITAFFLAPKHGNEGRSLASVAKAKVLEPRLERKDVAELLGDMRLYSKHLKLDTLPVSGPNNTHYQVKLTLDAEIQARVENIYEKYDPVYAAFVAMDPETGKILAMADHSSEGHKGNLNLRASFPAASIFKVITSAAALDGGKIRPHAMFPVNGRYGTLYKSNLRDTVNRWTKFISIEEAFAKSVNTVFAKIAMNRVGPEALQKYANAFSFNQHIEFDMPLDLGVAQIPVGDDFGLAESGSGYTRKQTLSPIQGAMIAAAVINEGKIPSPYLVDNVSDEQERTVYEAHAGQTLFKPIDLDTAKSLALIMEHTITRGTARREYRDYNHHPILSKLFIGAKTGSLSGDSPQGKYDWFVGFAQSSSNPKKKIVFASMIVNRKYWRVKASHVAREAILEHFKSNSQKEI